jgi:hypothetical protein
MPALSAENQNWLWLQFFLGRKLAIRKAHFQFSSMPFGKKMANYATFAFSLPFRHFLFLQFL